MFCIGANFNVLKLDYQRCTKFAERIDILIRLVICKYKCKETSFIKNFTTKKSSFLLIYTIFMIIIHFTFTVIIYSVEEAMNRRLKETFQSSSLYRIWNIQSLVVIHANLIMHDPVPLLLYQIYWQICAVWGIVLSNFLQVNGALS